MKVTIDNQNGQGPVDYTAALCADKAAEGAVQITRRMNQPTLARLLLDCTSHGLLVPAHNAAVVITAANGTILFTGYVPTQAEPVFAGFDSTGPRYRLQVHVISDDWLLDRMALPQTAPMLGQNAGVMARTLTTRVNPTLVNMSGLMDIGTIGFFEPQPNLSWSQNVAALANQARAAYCWPAPEPPPPPRHRIHSLPRHLQSSANSSAPIRPSPPSATFPNSKSAASPASPSPFVPVTAAAPALHCAAQQSLSPPFVRTCPPIPNPSTALAAHST